MKNAYDDESIFSSVIEERVRKPMKQDSAKCSMDDLKC